MVAENFFPSRINIITKEKSSARKSYSLNKFEKINYFLQRKHIEKHCIYKSDLLIFLILINKFFLNKTYRERKHGTCQQRQNYEGIPGLPEKCTLDI